MIKFLVFLVLAFVYSSFPSFAAGEKVEMEGVDCQNIPPIVEKVDSVAFEIIFEVVRSCLDKNRETTLTISNSGGSVSYALGIYDLIMNSPGRDKLTTVAYGEVASAAVPIFLAGKRRLMTCNSSLYLHEPFSEIEGAVTERKLQKMVADAKKSVGVFAAVHAEVTGLSVERIKSLFEKETTLRPTEAIRLKFATGIKSRTGKC